MTVLGLCCCGCFSLVGMNRGYSLAVMHGLLVVASLIAERGLCGM